MRKMQEFAPEIQKLKKKHGNDRQKMATEMQKLQSEHGVNPLGGCFPILVQIPVFISLYNVLFNAIELRQAPLVAWINDLSAHDRFFVLPLLMGAAMFAQFKLNPAPPDPMQAKIMQFMPLVMTGMMAWFPSGLVLYWLTNTVLSILQQWRINQVIQGAAKPSS